MSEQHDPDTDALSDEQKTLNWRFEQALEAGLTIDAAQSFASSDGDLHRLCDMIASGCSPAIAARIV